MDPSVSLCFLDGVTWLSIDLMNKCFYQHFAIIYNLASPFILGIHFIITALLTLHKSEKPYSAPGKECLAVIWVLEPFRSYAKGLHVTIYTVYTDYNRLEWLMFRPDPIGRLACWSLWLQKFDPFLLIPTDFLPECNIIGSLYCHTVPPVLLTDRAHIKQMQLDDQVTAQLSRNLGTDPCADMNGNSSSSSFVYHGLLSYKDPKHRCGLHQLKYLKHCMVPCSVTIMTTPLHVTVVFPKHS